MAQLAIQGHATRGKEVIKILEMLGGKNSTLLSGGASTCGYYIDSNGNIAYKHYSSSVFYDDIKLTIEEFLEKFPYKVGDKVKCWINGYCSINNIKDIQWDSITNEIKYKIQDYWYSTMNLQPYKEETMEEKGTLTQIDLTRELCVADEVEVILGDYEFMLKDGKTYFVKKQPQYPKTYEECCEVLALTKAYQSVSGYRTELLEQFQELFICRDAYWKIAGKQMGLGKPWEPNWLNTEQDKFVLYTHNNVICLNRFVLGHNVLAFPTAEMRDAFLENFKDLIEQCKEFL